MHPKVCGSVSILEPSLGIELGHEATGFPPLGENSTREQENKESEDHGTIRERSYMSQYGMATRSREVIIDSRLAIPC